ncbi:hypothetical protein B0H14DRAFT_532377 [Mycena olivaceomarginata]|nr:hypothetical protein B0H14DRAFT_532377 [Mycena olivaceomarginata]
MCIAVKTNGCFFEHYSGGSASCQTVNYSFRWSKLLRAALNRLWNPPYLPPWDCLTRPYHLCIDDAHNPLRPATAHRLSFRKISRKISQFQSPIGKVTMFPPDPIHNAVDKLHTVAAEESSRSTRGCYSYRRESTTPVHEELDCISPTASLLYARPGLVSSASGRACTCIPCMRETPPACTRHTILTPSTGPSTNSARPIHTNIPNQGVLHRSSPSSPLPSSTSLRPPSPFPSACSTSRFTAHRPRVCSRRRGVRGSARRPGSQTPSRRERSQSAGSTSGHGAHPAPSALILRAPPTCRRRARTTHKCLLPFVDNHSLWRLGWG